MDKERASLIREFDPKKPLGSVENPLQSHLPPAEWLKEIKGMFGNNGDLSEVYVYRNWALVKVDTNMNYDSPDFGGVYDEPAKILIEAFENTKKKTKGLSK